MKYRILYTLVAYIFLSPISQAEIIDTGASTIVAPETPHIISRSEWGADESYTHLHSAHWKEILEKRANYIPPNTDPVAAQKSREKYQQSLNYINTNFADYFKTSGTNKYDSEGNRLAWPVTYSQQVNAIVVHHTYSEYDSSEDGIHNVHKFHSLSRQWGDIGYNYLIGYDGEIYEGRKGGKYAIGAHSVWNNYSTVSVSLMGNYHEKGINPAQYESLEKMIKYLAWEYGIDFNNEYSYNTNCSGKACETFPIETYRESTLAGHRDTGHTTCPGDMLYAQIQKIRDDNLLYTKGFTPVKNGEIVPASRKAYKVKSEGSQMHKILTFLQKYSHAELEAVLGAINIRLETEPLEQRRKVLQMIKIGILSIVRD